jgi:hypothetical protein
MAPIHDPSRRRATRTRLAPRLGRQPPSAIVTRDDRERILLCELECICEIRNELVQARAPCTSLVRTWLNDLAASQHARPPGRHSHGVSITRSKLIPAQAAMSVASSLPCCPVKGAKRGARSRRRIFGDLPAPGLQCASQAKLRGSRLARRIPAHPLFLPTTLAHWCTGALVHWCTVPAALRPR